MKKKTKKKTKEKREVKFVKLNTLSKATLAKLNMKELWVIKPLKDKARIKARLCGCRNVCLA